MFFLTILFLGTFVIYSTVAVQEDVKPGTWKFLKSISDKRIVTAKSRYNCSGLLNEMQDLGINVTDCTTSRGNLWYRIDDLMTWEQSLEACRRIQGSDLASIHNVDDFNLLRYLFLMPDQDHTANWIGLNDIVKEGQWMWTDGTHSEYQRWLMPMKEPNGGNEENCVMYQAQVAGGGCCWADGFLDFRCSHELPAICKLKNNKTF